MEWRASIVVGVDVATHDQDWIVDVDGTFARSNKTLQAVLVELLAYVLLTADLEAATRNIGMFNLLIF